MEVKLHIEMFYIDHMLSSPLLQVLENGHLAKAQELLKETICVTTQYISKLQKV